MTKGDKLLMIFIVVISILSLSYVRRSAFNYDEKYISVQVNGEEIKKIIFDSNLIGTTIPVETQYGYNLIEIGEGKVRVIEADCPDQLDVKQGYISEVGEVIVCLPNRLVVELKGVEQGDIDHISR